MPAMGIIDTAVKVGEDIIGVGDHDDEEKNNQAELDLDSVKIPNTSIAAKVFEYAQESMPEKTFNHSMRVWNYGERRTALFAIFSRHLSEEQR